MLPTSSLIASSTERCRGTSLGTEYAVLVISAMLARNGRLLYASLSATDCREGRWPVRLHAKSLSQRARRKLIAALRVLSSRAPPLSSTQLWPSAYTAFLPNTAGNGTTV